MVVFDHPSFQLPEDHNAMIWRYMDFVKFISMLEVEGGSLHFTRLDVLRSEDPFEGLPPYTVQEQIEQDFIQHKVAPELRESCHEYVQEPMPCSACVNCWHCSEHDSAAMWKIYGRSCGIAVQSTIQGLIDAFQEAKENIRVGMVKYGDEEYRDLERSNTNFFDLDHWILHKRQSFAHEKELRVVIGDSKSETILPKNGITVRVPIAKLIKSLAIVPNAPSWFANLVKQMCKRYELDVEVFVGERPLW